MGMDSETADEVLDYLAGQLNLLPKHLVSAVPPWGSMCIDSPRAAIIALREAVSRSDPQDLIDAQAELRRVTEERDDLERELAEVTKERDTAVIAYSETLFETP